MYLVQAVVAHAVCCGPKPPIFLYLNDPKLKQADTLLRSSPDSAGSGLPPWPEPACRAYARRHIGFVVFCPLCQRDGEQTHIMRRPRCTTAHACTLLCEPLKCSACIKLEPFEVLRPTTHEGVNMHGPS